ncbi:MAG: hypothetical protein GXO27_04555 [Chlorobi bacterium]|nr:hypothetical protein [Chlorobiota bacterium]
MGLHDLMEDEGWDLNDEIGFMEYLEKLATEEENKAFSDRESEVYPEPNEENYFDDFDPSIIYDPAYRVDAIAEMADDSEESEENRPSASDEDPQPIATPAEGDEKASVEEKKKPNPEPLPTRTFVNVKEYDGYLETFHEKVTMVPFAEENIYVFNRDIYAGVTNVNIEPKDALGRRKRDRIIIYYAFGKRVCYSFERLIYRSADTEVYDLGGGEFLRLILRDRRAVVERFVLTEDRALLVRLWGDVHVSDR